MPSNDKSLDGDYKTDCHSWFMSRVLWCVWRCSHAQFKTVFVLQRTTFQLLE